MSTPRCPNCGAVWQTKARKRWHCGWHGQLVDIPLEIKRKRIAIDMMHKNPEVAKRVVAFLEIK